MPDENSPKIKMISTYEAREITGVSDQTIRNLIHKGKLRSVRQVDGRYLLEKPQIELYAQALRKIKEAFNNDGSA
jgi:excisionase family DNA binding protein